MFRKPSLTKAEVGAWRSSPGLGFLPPLGQAQLKASSLHLNSAVLREEMALITPKLMTTFKSKMALELQPKLVLVWFSYPYNKVTN